LGKPLFSIFFFALIFASFFLSCLLGLDCRPLFNVFFPYLASLKRCIDVAAFYVCVFFWTCLLVSGFFSHSSLLKSALFRSFITLRSFFHISSPSSRTSFPFFFFDDLPGLRG